MRFRVLPALALTIGLLLATFVYVFIAATDRRIEAERALTVERATLLFDLELRNYTALMSSTLESVSRDEALQKEMVAGNRDALVARLSPMFQRLRTEFGIEHFYVHRLDRVNLLRMHELDHSGDAINRITLKTVQRSGAPASGIEQGPTGQSVLRVVYPWKHQGQLIGYLELGTEFDTLAHRVHKVMGVDVMVFVFKKFLKEERWKHRNIKPRQSSWQEFPTVVLVDSTAPQLPAAVRTEVNANRILGESLVSKNEDRHTQIISLPLKDVDGRTLGGIFVLRDVSEIFAQARRSLIVVSATCLFVAVLVLGFFYVFLGRIERTLEEKKQKLAEANATLEQRVEARTQELKAAQAQLVDAARHAGQAEVAANVLHNVGNVLNSTNISVQHLEHLLENSASSTLANLAELFEKHERDLGKFLSEDQQGKQVPGYVRTLADALSEERSELAAEVRSLAKNVTHLKSVIVAQQSYARATARIEAPVDPKELIDDALRMAGHDFESSSVRIEREYDGVRKLVVDKQKFLQILVNVITNAKQAVTATQSAEKRISFRLGFKPEDPKRVLLEVSDTGVGIPEENLSRIFQHGFTTKPDGNGFGLHSAALAAGELGGSLIAKSEGKERGALFILELPVDGAGARNPRHFDSGDESEAGQA